MAPTISARRNERKRDENGEPPGADDHVPRRNGFEETAGLLRKRSLIEINLEVGYRNPSHFAQVFRRVVGVTPTEFRSSL